MELDSDPNVRYMIAGRETGENGTPHLQGYIELKEKKTHNQVKRMIPRAWIDLRKGTQEQAITYCKKEGAYDEFGEPSTGKRGPGAKKMSFTEMLEYANEHGVDELAMKDGVTASMFKDFIFRRTFVQKSSKVFRKPEFYWFWGPTGTGKTRRVYHEIGDENMFIKASGKWFDGYSGQSIMLMDDVREGTIDFAQLLRLTGGYEDRVELKGGSALVHFKKIYITSSLPPHMVFATSGLDSIAQIERRITECVEFKEEWTPPSPPRGEKEGDDESKLLFAGYKFQWLNCIPRLDSFIRLGQRLLPL